MYESIHGLNNSGTCQTQKKHQGEVEKRNWRARELKYERWFVDNLRLLNLFLGSWLHVLFGSHYQSEWGQVIWTETKQERGPFLYKEQLSLLVQFELCLNCLTRSHTYYFEYFLYWAHGQHKSHLADLNLLIWNLISKKHRACLPVEQHPRKVFEFIYKR